jgi:ubiquinone/menaquinone biosynthesis C-methylase UbiE
LEQHEIQEDFMKHWLDVLPKRFGIIEQFNHRFPLKTFHKGCKTLEIGAGIGAHLHFEDLASQEYVVLDIQQDLVELLQKNFPQAKALLGYCQKKIDYPDGYFDRVLAIHVLEHLPDLPAALNEIHRLLAPDGTYCVVIPCDPGFVYEIARNISARRIFEQRYHQSYDWVIKRMHINSPSEILEELTMRFTIVEQFYFPLMVPVKDLNLAIGLTLSSKLIPDI